MCYTHYRIKSRADALANLLTRARWFPKGDAARSNVSPPRFDRRRVSHERYFRHMLYHWNISPEKAARYTGEDVEQINEWRRDGVRVPPGTLPFLISQTEDEFYRRVGGGPVQWLIGPKLSDTEE